MMKKFMAVLFLVIMFIACDYAKDSLTDNPDIEVVYMNPIGWYTSIGDTVDLAVIEETKIIATNSIDCYLTKVIWEYVDATGDTFYTGEPFALYAKIEGLVSPGNVDTTTIENLGLPLVPARDHLIANNLEAATVQLHFIAVSEYDPEKTDTCDAWFGIYLVPLLD
jgi:hypothetical protein